METNAEYRAGNVMSLITKKKQELDELLNKAHALEREIEDLESWEPEKFRNEKSCLNQPIFAQGKCDECKFENRCVFEDKRNYGKFKLK